MNKTVPWTSLRLDPQNPRLRENLQGSDEEELVRHYLLQESADELIVSLLENGYFSHEPLLVRREHDGTYTVLEGNRRLTALFLIHKPDEYGLDGQMPIASQNQTERLSNIPVVIVENRDEVRRLIGYRHIGGLKKWKPEAKARFILEEVQRAAKAGEERPFKSVARQLGSNAQGIRNSYQALKILLEARHEDIDIAHVQYERFGVWQRAMNSAEVREYMGFGSPKTYSEVETAIENLDLKGLRTIISDLTPDSQGLAVLSDSRNVTLYGRILANPRAREALRLYRNLEVPAQIVRQEALADRIADLSKRSEVLIREVQEAEWHQELADSVEVLFKTARTLRAAVDALRPETEDV